MSETIQAELNDAAHLCVSSDGLVAYCSYHRDRLRCVAFEINDGVLEESTERTGFLRRTPDLKRLAELFASETPPAGGWALVQEQRQWLVERLVAVFVERRVRPIRVLEAGVAGPAHHSSYLDLVERAAELADAPEIRLVVADRCAGPLSALVRAPGRWRRAATPGSRPRTRGSRLSRSRSATFGTRRSSADSVL